MKLQMASVALLLFACGKAEAPSEGEPRKRRYQPDPTEVPVTSDFARAARRRVRADNYKSELSRIELELGSSR
jgi:hypothetical protein